MPTSIACGDPAKKECRLFRNSRWASGFTAGRLASLETSLGEIWIAISRATVSASSLCRLRTSSRSRS
ncbi:MAG TPA: hypothetical protein VLJ83_07295 [Gemmatimonadaceae bacterium]|nr:hypothetical protein [Gemmatimonadaceae bacterium]